MIDKWYDNFWTSPKNPPESLAFQAFGPAHLIALLICAVIVALLVVGYCKADDTRRHGIRLSVGIIVLLLELVLRQGAYLVLGIYTPAILPFYACSIVTFCVFIDAVKPNSWTRQFIYAVGTWGPLCALLFPDWTNQPIFNIYTWQSFLIHALMFGYALMLLVSKELVPRGSQIWKAAIMVVIAVIIALIFNAIYNTNFWFLNTGSPGSPLEPIQNLSGNFYIPVLVVLVAILWTIMYLPWYFAAKSRNAHGRRGPQQHPASSTKSTWRQDRSRNAS